MKLLRAIWAWPGWLKGMLGGILVIAALWGAWTYYERLLERERYARYMAEFQLQGQLTLLDGQAAMIASQTLRTDSLQSLVQAGHELNGKLVAALKLHVAARDTVIIHAQLPTEFGDTGRTARWRDSTFAGLVTGTVFAPRDPALPLYLTYHVERPAFNPTIGFIEVRDSLIAVVDWQGETAEIMVPYFKHYTKQPGLFGGLVGGFTEVNWRDRDGFELRGGALVRLGRWRLQASLAQELQQKLTAPHAAIGVRREF